MLGNYPVAATLPAADIERAKKFYTETLGLKLSDLPDEMEGTAMFEAGMGTQIFIYQREGNSPEHTAASFAVDDLDKVVGDLIAKGVTFEQYDFGEIKTDERGIATIGEQKSAWLKDSEGNIIAITLL